MRWFGVRRAQIEPELRTTFEQYGVPVMQQVLSVGSDFRHKGQTLWVESVRGAVLSWLTERYDRDERKETWQITMEAAVTILVFFELLVGIGSLIYTGYEFRAQDKQFKNQVQHQDDQFKVQKTILDTQLAWIIHDFASENRKGALKD